MITVSIQVIARANSRSTSYNVKDVERALKDAGLEPAREGMFFKAEQSCKDRKSALITRKAIELGLKRVHRNILYRFEFSGV